MVFQEVAWTVAEQAIDLCVPLKPKHANLDFGEHGETAYHSPVRQYIQEPKKLSGLEATV